uniref:Uncharacterized protein n=1 Tax=Buteo japonicus TaxID=224669 RepID=A0A8B9Z9B9_9AVES
MHDDQEGRASDKDQLQEVVVADVGAARLPRVAVKVLLLISPHTLRRHHVDQHAEDEHHGEPDAAEGCGVLVDPADAAAELGCRDMPGTGFLSRR